MKNIICKILYLRHIFFIRIFEIEQKFNIFQLKYHNISNKIFEMVILKINMHKRGPFE